MVKSRQHLAFGALAAVVVALTSMTPSRDARAQALQANLASVCDQLPALKAAMEYTVTTWPPTVDTVAKAGLDTINRLAYFGLAVEADHSFCKLLAPNGGIALQVQPEAVLGTMLWHYGNASLALREYQSAASTVH